MEAIKTLKEYKEAQAEIETLLGKVGDDHSFDNPDFVRLDQLSDWVADYEDAHFHIDTPSLIDVIQLRMYENGWKQADLARVLSIPKPRVSEYLRGKREITLEVAKKLHHLLNIDGDIILQ